jgi:hypothetical protein
MTLAGSPTVFIIDDETDLRASSKDLLESVGIHFESFGTAEEFLDASDWTGQVAWSWTRDFPESTVWTFSAGRLTWVFRFLSYLLPVTETFR